MSLNDTTNEVPYGYCHCGCGRLTTIAPHSDKATGAIKGEPRKFIKNHNQRRPLANKFWEKVVVTNDDACWIWIGAKTRLGYGSIGVDGKTMSAHRVAWILAYEVIPDGLEVLHHCDNPACVNVKHLFLGTKTDNMRDKNTKKRGNYLIGSAKPQAKLTEEQVKQIRSLAADGMRLTGIAKMFDVTDVCISHIIKRRQWKHVP